jgi:hypothetical protein
VDDDEPLDVPLEVPLVDVPVPVGPPPPLGAGVSVGATVVVSAVLVVVSDGAAAVVVGTGAYEVPGAG